jgi:hypothetical protein
MTASGSRNQCGVTPEHGWIAASALKASSQCRTKASFLPHALFCHASGSWHPSRFLLSQEWQAYTLFASDGESSAVKATQMHGQNSAQTKAQAICLRQRINDMPFR